MFSCSPQKKGSIVQYIIYMVKVHLLEEIEIIACKEE